MTNTISCAFPCTGDSLLPHTTIGKSLSVCLWNNDRETRVPPLEKRPRRRRMTGSKKLSRQNRQKTEQLCLSLVCRHKTSSVGWDLLGQCLRVPLWWQEQWNLSDAWERRGVKESFPSLGGISWVHRARWITSPQQHQEGSLRETWCPHGWKKRGGLQGSSKQAAVLSESWQPMVMATLHWKLSLRGWCSRYRGYRTLWPALRLPKWASSQPLCAAAPRLLERRVGLWAGTCRVRLQVPHLHPLL